MTGCNWCFSCSVYPIPIWIFFAIYFLCSGTFSNKEPSSDWSIPTSNQILNSFLVCRQYRVPLNGKSVLITGQGFADDKNYKLVYLNRPVSPVKGCDSGFGFILAQDLKNNGCDVIATSINPSSENPTKLKNKGIKVVGCDVSKDRDF